MDDNKKCLACNGEGLASSATVEAQRERLEAAITQAREADVLAREADHRWRLAAEAVLIHMTIQDRPALEFIDKVVALGERVSA